jgi:uncharacterized membrane protein YoaK (UPF0700 family)
MQITLHTPETIYTPRHVPSWMLLSGAAGFVNGFGFLACQQYVTHVTGTVTRAGLELPNVGIAAEYAIVFFSFIAGAAAAVIVVQLRARADGPDRWMMPLFAVAMILALVAVLGHYKGLETFGSLEAEDPPPVLLLCLLSFASGLQNASVASTTGMSVRTTHLTGPTTDIGMLLGAACLADGGARRSALAGAALRGGMVFSFMIGAALSLPLSYWMGYLALLAPALFVLIAGALSFMPQWGPSDFPLERRDVKPPSFGTHAGLPGDARPLPDEAEAPEGSREAPEIHGPIQIDFTEL